MTCYEVGDNGEFAVAQWLRNKQFSVTRTGRFAPFDIYTDKGTTVEVKTAYPSKSGRRIGWKFSIARHKKRCQERCVDFYVLRLEAGSVLREFGMSKALHLVIPAADIRKKSVWISFRALVTKWIGCANATHLIKASDQRKEPIDLARAVIRACRHSSQVARLQKKHGLSDERIQQATREIERIQGLAAQREILMNRIAREPRSAAEEEL